MQPSINSLLTSRVSPMEIGGTLGISAALLSAANAFAPLIGGFLFDRVSSSAPYFFGAVLVALLILLSIRGLSKKTESEKGVS
jgi:MFS family permease